MAAGEETATTTTTSPSPSPSSWFVPIFPASFGELSMNRIFIGTLLLVILYSLVMWFTGQTSFSTSMFNMISLGGVILFVFLYVANQPVEVSVASGKSMIIAYLQWLKNEYSAFAIAGAMLLLYLLAFLLSIDMTVGGKPILIRVADIYLWCSLAMAVLHWAILRLFGINVMDHLIALIQGNGTTPSVSETGKQEATEEDEEENKDKDGDEEVYNVSDNLFSYEDAQMVCQANGARLATYAEIEDAYKQGGEWCNYGWSADQMAFFPTQKGTWDKLQANPKTKHACGRPGINGGFIDNPEIRFGANCYGKKPKATASDRARMDVIKTIPEASDPLTDAKLKYWKEHGDKLTIINGFNRNQWSQY